jgi:energy-coupling factor transporter ATP-binding protein EcfA2
MYQLIRLSLKNWYLCTCEDIAYRGSIGMVGPTGSGKSSLLDAIQTAICGASHNRVHLNASSESHSDRKILEYCLGYTVPKKDGGEPERPSCESIIALTFREERLDGTANHVSAGVVMTAREGESREVMVTRFIAPGLAVSAEDWKGHDAEGRYVKDWDEIVVDMKRACPGLREYRTSAERFVSDLLAEMRHGARQPDVKRFLAAFFNAIAFKPINNPTQFMRDFILERDDLDIERVRARVGHWKELSAAVRTVEEKLEALKVVTRAYDSWGRAVLDRRAMGMRKACAAVERRRLTYGAAGKAWRGAVEAKRAAEHVRDRLVATLAGEREELDQKKATLTERGIDGRLTQIDTERKLLGHEIDKIEAPVEELRKTLRAVGNLTTVRDFIPGSFMPTIAGAKAALAIVDDKPGLDWLKHGAADVTTHIGKFKALGGLPERLEPQMEALAAELTDLRRRRDALSGGITHASKGGAVISGHTQELIGLLRADGIESVALCDVVEVDDQSWQLAVESLLGARREALIVDPAQVKRAHHILYRHRNSHGLHNCRLVKTTRTADVVARFGAESIASVVRSDDPHARAYLATHLGGFRMAEDEVELERHSRAIMRNGKATSSLDYMVHRDQGMNLILGRTARERSAAQEVRSVREEIAQKQRIYDQLHSASQIAKGAAAYEIDLTTLAFKFEEIERRGRELEGRRDSVLSDADRELADDIGLLEGNIAERQNEVNEQQATINALTKRELTLEVARDTARAELRKGIRDKRAAIRTFDDEEVQKLAVLVPLPTGDRFGGALNPFYGNKLAYRGRPAEAIGFYESCEAEAESELRNLTADRISRLASIARNRLIDNYCRAYTIERPYTDDVPYHFDYTWAVLHYERLEKNELRQHREEAQRAEQEMVSAIKEDLLSRLTDKFGRLDDQLRALNSHLRRHRFTGQVYKFGKKVEPTFDKIRRLALAVAGNPDNAEAIIEKRHEDPMLREAMGQLEAYIETSDGAGLEDYRRYFMFDLYMLPESQADEEVDNVRGRMSLSARATVGSGGETQAPYYVAMAASMAMAYFPGGQPASGPTGMGLVLFDEAFNRLDVPNTQSLIRFFADLGLQLMVAAPEGERPTFTEVFDTIVTVSKSTATKTVYIASDYPKERARRELSAINPNHKGVEGFRAELAAALAAASPSNGALRVGGSDTTVHDVAAAE